MNFQPFFLCLLLSLVLSTITFTNAVKSVNLQNIDNITNKIRKNSNLPLVLHHSVLSIYAAQYSDLYMTKYKVPPEILTLLNKKLDFKPAINSLPQEQAPKGIDELKIIKKESVVISFRQGNRPDLDLSVTGS